ncbi:unnamed protein product, partial [Callosobruchus maculatus]
NWPGQDLPCLTCRDKTCLALIGRDKRFPCLNWPRRPLVLP